MDNYGLRLADGTSWRVAAASESGEMSALVDRFAGILGLRKAETDSSCQLLFLPADEVRQLKDGPYGSGRSLVPGEASAEWQMYDHESLKVWCHKRIPQVICEIGGHGTRNEEIMNMWNALQPVFQRVQKSGGLPFHGALLEFAGKGVVIAAPGNTGKSTCCRRVPATWQPLCDDELLVVRDEKGGYQAHPFPTWSDYLWRNSQKKWVVENSLPLQAIFFLEQARADESVAVGKGQAALLIHKSAAQVCQKFWRKSDKEHRRSLALQLFRNACVMAKTIPAYTLKATLEGRFWKEMEGRLQRHP